MKSTDRHKGTGSAYTRGGGDKRMIARIQENMKKNPQSGHEHDMPPIEFEMIGEVVQRVL